MNDLSPTQTLNDYHAGIRLQTLYAINEMLQTATMVGLELPAILTRLLQTVLRELRSQAVCIIILKDDGITEYFWQHENDAQTPPTLVGSDVLRQGITGWVNQNQQTALIGNTLNDRRWLPQQPSDTPLPWSAICAPLPARQTVAGFITVMKSGVCQFSQDDASWLEVVAGLTAAAIESKRLFDDNQRRASENAQQLDQAAKTRYHQAELEKMREELMAMLVHDLQSPLSNIISSLELVTQEIDARTHPLAITILDIARRSSQRLRTLISSLLDISRLEAGQPVSDRTILSPARLIAAAQEAVLPVLQQRRIHLALNLEPDLPDVHVDADMITRVLINLLDNALRFTPKEQSLTITASHDTTNTGYILMSVADQGPGVPPKYRQAVFDKYYRIPDKNGSKGIGLGLAFCRLAVEAHGGRIWVDQAPGGGALFSFTLPLAVGKTNE